MDSHIHLIIKGNVSVGANLVFALGRWANTRFAPTVKAASIFPFLHGLPIMVILLFGVQPYVKGAYMAETLVAGTTKVPWHTARA